MADLEWRPMPLPPTFPDLASLDLFATVVAVGSLSGAAAEHGISQPSASARIRHLERQLGVTLLDRSPRGSTPTETGRLIAGWVEHVLAAAHQLRAGLDALDADHVDRLRVVASFTIAEYLLPAWLGQLRQRHEHASVELAVANSTGVLEAVRQGSVDLGFVESPGDIDDLETTVIARDELVAVVAPTHPWASRASVSAETLAPTPLVLREPESGTRQFLNRALARAGLEPPVVALELGSTSAIKNAVATGAFPGVLSRLAVDADHASGRLAVVRIEGLDLGRDLRAVRRPATPRSEAAASLIAIASRSASR